MNIKSTTTNLLFFCMAALNLYAQRPKEIQEPAINIPFVTVDFPNNKADRQTGYGAVLYNFSISEYPITAEEYCAFLNAVASKRDPHGLYHSGMTYDVTVASMTRSGSEGNYHYTPIKGREALPIAYVSIFDAARFCNWLEHGQPSGDEQSTETGAYTLKGDQGTPLVRTEGAKYCLPSENEWYKAAYYDGTKKTYYTFPNRSNWSPHRRFFFQEPSHNEANYGGALINKSGEDDHANFLQITSIGFYKTSMSPYGAFDMGGNLAEWTESRNQSESEDLNVYDVRGGSWQSTYNYYGRGNDLGSSAHNSVSGYQASNTVGFRIVKVTGKATTTVSLSDAPDDYWLTPMEAAGVAAVGVGFVTAGVAKAAMAPTEAATMIDATKQRVAWRTHAPLGKTFQSGGLANRRESIVPFHNPALSPVVSPTKSPISSSTSHEVVEGVGNRIQQAQDKQAEVNQKLTFLKTSEASLEQKKQEIWSSRKEGWTHVGRMGANIAATPLTCRLIDLAVVAFGNTYGTSLVTALLGAPPHRWPSMVDDMGYLAAGTAGTMTLRHTYEFLREHVPQDYANMNASFAAVREARKKFYEDQQSQETCKANLRVAQKSQTAFYEEFLEGDTPSDTDELIIKSLRLNALAHDLVEHGRWQNQQEYEEAFNKFVTTAESVYTEEIITLVFPQEEREVMKQQRLPWTASSIDGILDKADRIWVLRQESPNNFSDSGDYLQSLLLKDTENALQDANEAHTNLRCNLERQVQGAQEEREQDQSEEANWLNNWYSRTISYWNGEDPSEDDHSEVELPPFDPQSLLEEANFQRKKAIIHTVMAVGPSAACSLLSYSTMALTGPHLALALAAVASLKSDWVVSNMYAVVKAAAGQIYRALPEETRNGLNEEEMRLSLMPPTGSPIPEDQKNRTYRYSLLPAGQEISQGSSDTTNASASRKISAFFSQKGRYSQERHAKYTRYHSEKATEAFAEASKLMKQWKEYQALQKKVEAAQERVSQLEKLQGNSTDD